MFPQLKKLMLNNKIEFSLNRKAAYGAECILNFKIVITFPQ